MVKHVILILGMHRSGTSSVTRVMNLRGAALPKTLLGQNDGNLRGHWESQAIIDSHNQMLSALGSHWSDWRPLGLDTRKSARARMVGEMADMIGVEYRGADIAVIKEPRICRFAQTYLEAIKSLGASVHVIIPIRNPLEVAASLSKRDGLSQQHGQFLWLSHMIQAARDSRGASRAFVDYAAFLTDPVAETARMSADMPFALPFSTDDARSQIEAYIDPTLKREAARAEDVAQNPLSMGWINDVYQALLILTQNPDAADAMATIDRVAEQFYGASDMIWAIQMQSDSLQKTQEQALADSGAALSAMDKAHQEAWAAAQDQSMREIAGLKDKFESRIAALNTTLGERDTHIKAVEAVIAQHETENSAHKEQIKTLSEAAEAALGRETQLKTALEALQTDITTLKKEREARESAFEALKSDYNRDITQAEAQISTLEVQISTARQDYETQIAALNAQASETDAAAKANIASLIKERDFMQDEFAQMLQSVETGLETAHHELWKERADKAAAERALTEVLSSSSWRMTKGIRAVMNKLRGNSGPKSLAAPDPVARITHEDKP